MAERARRRFAVLGHPVDHSLSPVMHRAAYAMLGVDDASYGRIAVDAGSLAAALAPGGRGAELAGASVTMPLKREAVELAVEHDETSSRLGIANTLIRRSDGRWRAENHDVAGIVRALADHGTQQVRTGSVIGSGATALSAVEALAQMGAEQVLLTARSLEKLRSLTEHAQHRGMSVQIVDFEDPRPVLQAEVCISALALAGAEALAERLTGHGAGRELAGDGLSSPRWALDVLYHPWPAPMARLFGALGADVAGGLEMLAHQAALQVASMLPGSGGDQGAIDPAPLLAAARAELTARS